MDDSSGRYPELDQRRGCFGGFLYMFRLPSKKMRDMMPALEREGFVRFDKEVPSKVRVTSAGYTKWWPSDTELILTRERLIIGGVWGRDVDVRFDDPAFRHVEWGIDEDGWLRIVVPPRAGGGIWIRATFACRLKIVEASVIVDQLEEARDHERIGDRDRGSDVAVVD